MRFHHSTRRGRNRFSQGGNHHSAQGGSGKFGGGSHSTSLSSRWAQLSYCRQTNIHFNRRLPVELPEELRERTSVVATETGSSLTGHHLIGQQDDMATTLAEAGIAANGRLTSASADHHTRSNNHNHHHHQQQHLSPDLDTYSERHLNLKQLDKLSLSSEGQIVQQQQTDETNVTQHKRQNSVRRTREGAAASANTQHSHQTTCDATTANKYNTTSQQDQQQLESKLGNNIDNKRSATNNTTTIVACQQARLDLEGAREKLIAQVDKHPFWSTKAARRMRLLDLHERQIYIYELTSYCEKRDLEWRYEAYRGGKLGSGPFGVSSASVPAAAAGGGLLRRTPTVVGTVHHQQGQQPSSPVSRTLPIGSPSSGDATNNEPPPYQSAGGNQGAPVSPSHQQQANGGRLALISAISHNSTIQRPQQLALAIGGDGGGAVQQHQSYPLVPGERRLHHAHYHNHQQQSSANNRLRRSCSSATSSPVHHQHHTVAGAPFGGFASSTTGAASVVQSLSSTPLQTTPPSSGATPGEPRPLPGPELVWSIEPPEHLRPQLFSSYVHTSEVPGTSFVKRCHGCDGRGRLKCTSCYGVGYEVCLSCTGKGSLRSYSAMSAGGGLGSTSRSGLGVRSGGGGGVSGSDQYSGRDQSVTGSMWANADESSSSSRLGGGRHNEPGGITSASSEICANCSGAGQKRCWICAGRSFITCTACAGTGSLRCFLNLNITYTNHRDEVCLNNSDGIIPRDRLKLSSGLILADEIADRLRPLASGGDSGASASYSSELAAAQARLSPEGVPNSQHSNHSHHHQHNNRANTPTNSSRLLEQMTKPGELIQLSLLSAKLLDKHWNTYKQERLIKQRHRVTQIECFKVDWEFRKKRGHFVIYGDERKVYIAKYPFKSICNIT
uniref:Uncharacterized protein C3orf32 n=1 Tax=Aceria tosichella TaxID=561515 RepID=A0A6G1SMQ7_9ACAR